MTLSLNEMKSWWNDAAQWNARSAILSGQEQWDEEEFLKTGIGWRAQWENMLLNVTVDARPLHFGGEKMLDFGCGLGRMTRAWREFYASSVGVDISPEMIRMATESNSDPHISYVQLDSYPLPFKAEEFDLVFSTIVVQHISMPHSYQYVSEFFRICAKGGMVAFDAPSSFSRPMGDGMFALPFPVIDDLAKRSGMQLLALQAGALEPLFHRYLFKKM